MSNKLFLSGEPGIGKSTILQKVIQNYGDACVGFYAREIRENDVRVGFEMVTINLPIQGGPLAHVNFDTAFSVGRYKIDTTHLDKIFLHTAQLFDKNKLLIIDEIGLMQSYSEPFKEFVASALASSSDVLATIKAASTPWTDEVKDTYKHIPLAVATLENRDELPQKITRYFKNHEPVF